MYVIVMHGGLSLFNTQYPEKYSACQEKKGHSVFSGLYYAFHLYSAHTDCLS